MKIVPKSKRAKERVRQHGEEMHHIQDGKRDGRSAVLVRSKNKTGAGRQHWYGWFTDEEIEF